MTGRPVRAGEPEHRIGWLRDLVVDVSHAPASVSRIVVGDFQGRWSVPWTGLVLMDADAVRVLEPPEGPVPEPLVLAPHELMLVRDVLDTRVYDIPRRRTARVGDVWLQQEADGSLVVEGLEVGAEVLLKRLGLRRRGGPSRLLPLSQAHLTSLHGHRVQLATPGSSVHGLDGPDLAHLLTHLPLTSAVDVVRQLPAHSVERAAQHLHPHLLDRLGHALDGGGAAPSRRLRRTDGWRTYRPETCDGNRRARKPGARP